MRVVLASLVFVGTLFGGYHDEPNERQMRLAYERTLALYVRNALDFLEEAAGPAAVVTALSNGTDRYELRTFRKIECAPVQQGRGHLCTFDIDIGVVNGTLQRTLTGRFFGPANMLTFAEQV